MVKVYYSGSFWGSEKSEHAGKEMKVNREFTWENRKGLVPSIYVCAKGLVMDICLGVSQEEVKAFMKRWNIRDGNEKISDESREQVDRENPLNIHFSLNAWINGEQRKIQSSCATTWLPFVINEAGDAKATGTISTERNPEEPENELVSVYELNPTLCWKIFRVKIPWEEKEKKTPDIKTLSIQMIPDMVKYMGQCFTTKISDAYKEIPFEHPVTRKSYVLHLEGCEEQNIPEEMFSKRDKKWSLGEWPVHFQTITYYVTPELPNNMFQINDYSSGDRPRINERSCMEEGDKGGNEGDVYDGVASVGIIGGAYGPTAINTSGKYAESQKRQTAISSLHFERVDKIHWKMVFWVKEKEEFYLDILR